MFLSSRMDGTSHKKKHPTSDKNSKDNSQTNVESYGEQFRYLTGAEQSDRTIPVQKKENPKIVDEDRSSYSYQQSNGNLYVDEANSVVSSSDTSGAGININDVEQGALGDCYFLAAIGAMAKTNPGELQKLIKDNGDGTYDVTLHVKEHWYSLDHTPTVITVNGEFPMRSNGSPAYADYGDTKEIWVMLLEKAFAKYSGGYEEIEGGNPGEAMTMLTGNSFETMYTLLSSENELLERIDSAMNENIPATASSRSLDSNKEEKIADATGAVGGHAYIIQSVNRSSQTISLYNPWGSSHLNSLSISDFKKIFYRVQFGNQ